MAGCGSAWLPAPCHIANVKEHGRMSVAQDYYAILGLQPDAGREDINRAYRKVALRLHPDKNPGDAGAAERFQMLHEAYSVLNDQDLRRLYDRKRLLEQERGARDAQSHAKRRTMREDLLHREKEAASRRSAPTSDTDLESARDAFNAALADLRKKQRNPLFEKLFSRNQEQNSPQPDRNLYSSVPFDLYEAQTINRLLGISDRHRGG